MSDNKTLQFEFSSSVLFDDTVPDGYMKHYVPIPEKIAAAFQDADIRHLQGTINSHSFRRVLNVREDGTGYLNFGMTWLKQAKLNIDMEVMMRLEPDPDPDKVDLPTELAAELQVEPEIMKAWSNLSTSRQKTYAYGVARAKKSETRQRRSRAIIEELRESPTE